MKNRNDSIGKILSSVELNEEINSLDRLLCKRINTCNSDYDFVDDLNLNIHSKLVPLVANLREYFAKESNKNERIAFLKGITTYSIWADSVPNGDELFEKYKNELEELLKDA